MSIHRYPQIKALAVALGHDAGIIRRDYGSARYLAACDLAYFQPGSMLGDYGELETWLATMPRDQKEDLAFGEEGAQAAVAAKAPPGVAKTAERLFGAMFREMGR